MEVVARERDTVTIKFKSMEVVDLIRITGAAAQGYADLDVELLDHLTNEEVSNLSVDLASAFGRRTQNV